MSELTSQSILEPRSFGTITREWLREYADASGDHNQIHLDEAVALAMGLPGIIAHGMLVSSLMHSRLQSALSESPELAGFRLAKTQTRFRGMCRLGDEVRVGGGWHVSGATEVTVELQAKNERGETLVTGVFKLASAPAA